MDVKEQLEQVRKELEDYRKQRQQELDEFMRTSGMLAFIQETDRHVAFLQGKIIVLESFLPDKEG